MPGLNLTRLAAWFTRHVPETGGSLSARLITGGKSNLTYEVSDGASIWIVRRPPLAHVLSTAHDMSREYRVMSALRSTEIPVPLMIAIDESGDVLGAPFYVMSKVDGVVYRSRTQLESLGRERTRVISERLVDTLVALHRIDPDEIGLTGFGRPQGYLARQVRRWRQQLVASYSRELPAAEQLFARLLARLPEESAVGVVHGDFRLDNALVAPDDQIRAIVDWEMATLGDPLADLALMLTYARLAQIADRGLVADGNLADGYLSEEEIIARYTAGSLRDVSRFQFYLGLAAYKLAAIIEGIHFRHLRGQTVGLGFDRIGDAVHPLLAAGLTALDG